MRALAWEKLKEYGFRIARIKSPGLNGEKWGEDILMNKHCVATEQPRALEKLLVTWTL